MVTDSPSVLNHSTLVSVARKLPISPSLFSSNTTTAEPTNGPDSVPRPPTSVISTTWPDAVQCTSLSVANPSTRVLSEPASPDSAADSTNASSLKRLVS